jgi:15-cis-phytoene synthase
MSTDTATAITKNSRSSFYYSFNLLPKEKRDAIYTVYAFCKHTDYIVDDHAGNFKEKSVLLTEWRNEFEKAIEGESSNPLLIELESVVRRYNIPVQHFTDLIRGVEMDLRKNRYETFDELSEYCYHVASTVGMMCAEIFGYTSKDTKQYAIDLGIALQLTNIIRDIKTDLARDRIYIPREDLDRFKYTEADLYGHVYDDRFVELMRFQAMRARSYYSLANASLARNDEKHFFAARIMERIYYAILRKIERNNFDIFRKKIRMNRLQQLCIALNIWFSHRVLPVR